MSGVVAEILMTIWVGLVATFVLAIGLYTLFSLAAMAVGLYAHFGSYKPLYENSHLHEQERKDIRSVDLVNQYSVYEPARKWDWYVHSTGKSAYAFRWLLAIGIVLYIIGTLAQLVV